MKLQTKISDLKTLIAKPSPPNPMTTTTTTTTPALAEPGTAARLTARVCRMPASLGGYHYYLEPGQLVFITGHAGGELARRLPGDATVLRKPFRALELVTSIARLAPEVA